MIWIYVTMAGMIEAYLKKINQGLADLLTDVNRRYGLSRISPQLARYSKEFVLRKGKRIRPLLFVFGYEGYTCRPTADIRGLFTSAASIELLHDFMLIHDDVIDKSALRRGKPTLHKLFDQKIRLADHAKIGPELAIVAGDILFAVAIEALLAIRENPERKELALRKLVATAAHTGAGEFIDVVFGHQRLEDLTEKDVFLTYTLKTAKFTVECPLVMGALLAGAKRQEIGRLSSLGIAAGQAFQLYDDFLDLFASQKIIGKPVLSDLVEAKKTLMVIKAYR
ncbi:MAG: polyprenyl synthetase family protein, partial [Candidatus Omnitrophota bacterium]